MPDPGPQVPKGPGRLAGGVVGRGSPDLDTLPIGPWAAPGVLAGWAVAALLGDGPALRLRDA
ncbi:hypothetical protein OG784_24685 [Streptomyces sp. NBC_01617]|uniref:hypothetical protein n=1 Tax=Streptomyces sp. NBC_01617 TaxID=2975899 RepID=UPI003867A218|nr:hypothetical protein OG784_24685 [Streptomyces sp. NBC_01617]